MKLVQIPTTYQPAPNLLEGSVILVTGAGDGLGRAASLAYARHGATVILLGRTQKKLERIYDQIKAEKLAEPLLMPVDLTRITTSDCEQIASAIDVQFGKLNGMLHSAAMLGALTPLHHYALNTWMDVMQVNLNAAFLLTRACLPVLGKADSSVIFTTSDVAREGKAYWGPYAAAGAALENLAQTWADELAENTSIRINTLNPGAARTAMRTSAYPGENPQTLPAPDDLMYAYLYLAGPDSRGHSGHAFHL